MRICFVSHGALIHVQPYIEYFASQGHEVFFIAITPGAIASANGRYTTVKAWFGGDESYSSGFSKWKYLLSSLKVRSIIRKIKPDVINAHYATSGGIAVLLARHKNILVTAHGTDLNEATSFLWSTLLKLIFRKSKVIHVVSQDLKNKALALGAPEHKVIVVNVGALYDSFYYKREAAVSTKLLRMVCNRSFEDVYMHSTILGALTILKDQGIPYKMIFLGSGSLKDDIVNYVESNNLSSMIEFKGRIPNADILPVYQTCDIYLSSSRSDGTSVSLLEAMAAGLFPIVSDIPANTEWITHQKNGLLFRFDDPKSLADCLKSVYDGSFEISADEIVRNQYRVYSSGNRNKNMKAIEEICEKMVFRSE